MVAAEAARRVESRGAGALDPALVNARLLRLSNNNCAAAVLAPQRYAAMQGAVRMPLGGLGRLYFEVPPPPPSRTKWTRLVYPSVLIGHVSSLRGRAAAARGCPCAPGLKRHKVAAPALVGGRVRQRSVSEIYAHKGRPACTATPPPHLAGQRDPSTFSGRDSFLWTVTGGATRRRPTTASLRSPS